MAPVFMYLTLDFSINRKEKLMEEQEEVKKIYTTKNTQRELSVGG